MSEKINFGTPEHEKAMKQYIASLLVKQAQADGDFSVNEKKYLKYAGDALDLSDRDIAAVRLDPDAFEISPPQDEMERIQILYYLLFMMRIDKNITSREEALCHKMGLRLGFRTEMITNLITVMKEYLLESLPPEAMIERIRPFLN